MGRDLRSIQRSLRRGGWVDAGGIAALIFLTLLAAGAALLLAGKLQFPSLGSGADPLDVLRGVGLVALAILGVTTDIDGLSLSVIPLGALALVGVAGARLARETFRSRERSGASEVFKVGAMFALFCTAGASFFRFGGTVPVEAPPFEAWGLGLVWGSAIAGSGAALASGWRPLGWVDRLPNRAVREGVRVGVWIVKAATLGALGALLCVLVGRLAGGPLPRSFGVGDALAVIIYLVAFLPNALVAVFGLAVGGTLTIGAQVDVDGSIVGPVHEHSLLSWGRGDAPAGLVLLFLLPLCVSIAGGVWAARRDGSLPAAFAMVMVAGLVLAAVVGLLASVSDARLGAGLLKEQGVGLVSVNAPRTAFLTFLWTVLGGTVGIALEKRIDGPSKVTVA